MPHVRCSVCSARRTLAKRLDAYVRMPPCRKCGAKRYRVDKFRNSGRERRGMTCNPGRGGCGGYSFPHRRGGGYCWHNPNLTEREELERKKWA